MDKPSRDEELRALVEKWNSTYGGNHDNYDTARLHSANELAEILARHDAQGEADIGKTVSVDMSTDDASAEHRIFGKVIGVQDDTLLCEFVEQNYCSKREAVVTERLEPGHSAFPWHTEIGSFGYVIDTNGDTVAICEDDDGIGKKDAAFIVAACNAYRTAALAAKEANS